MEPWPCSWVPSPASVWRPCGASTATASACPTSTTRDGGAYYYQGGWNVLALVTMAVLFISFSCASLSPSSKWIYDSSYLLGCVFAFVIYSALCKRQDR